MVLWDGSIQRMDVKLVVTETRWSPQSLSDYLIEECVGGIGHGDRHKVKPVLVATNCNNLKLTYHENCTQTQRASLVNAQLLQLCFKDGRSVTPIVQFMRRIYFIARIELRVRTESH